MISGFEENYGMAPFTIPLNQNTSANQQNPYSQGNMQGQGMPNYNFSSTSYKHGGHVGLSHIAERLRQQGEEGDNILAHINPQEAEELHYRYGSDINPHTGLPQYGFLKKIRKGLRKAGLSKILPAAGAIAGNYFLPGIGGILGGGAAGALSKKSPLKGILQGAGMGALQGYGFPIIGKALSSSGMPQLGSALSHLGGSHFGSALGALTNAPGALQAYGVSKALEPREKKQNFEDVLERSIALGRQGQGEGGMSNILEYLLLGLAGAGMIGGKTKYKIPGEYENEPGYEELAEKMRPKPRPEDKARYIAPYEPSPESLETPGIGGGASFYEYPEFKKGGYVKGLKKIAQKVKKKGEGEDKVLAHINPQEAKELDKRQGHDINKSTGLPQYGFLKKVIKEAKRTVRDVGHAPAKLIHEAAKVPNIIGKEAKRGIKNAGKIGEDIIDYSTSYIPKKPKQVIMPEIENLPQEAYDPIFMGNLMKQLNVDPYQSMMKGAYEEYGRDSFSNLYDRVMSNFEKESDKAREISPYEPSMESLREPGIGRPFYEYPEFEKGKTYQEYPTFKEGGYVEGSDGGQDDNVITKLPEGSYIIDATTVSLLGDGNSQSGRKHLDGLFEKYKHFAKGSHIPQSEGAINARISQGEYEVPPHIVSAMGGGDNRKGAKEIKNMIANIRRHKGVKKLPPKSKPLSSYLRG